MGGNRDIVYGKTSTSIISTVSTFYSTKDALGPNFVMPTFDAFAKRLTCEKDKLIQMGALGSKNS